MVDAMNSLSTFWSINFKSVWKFFALNTFQWTISIVSNQLFEQITMIDESEFSSFSQR